MEKFRGVNITYALLVIARVDTYSQPSISMSKCNNRTPNYGTREIGDWINVDTKNGEREKRGTGETEKIGNQRNIETKNGEWEKRGTEERGKWINIETEHVERNKRGSLEKGGIG